MSSFIDSTYFHGYFTTHFSWIGNSAPFGYLPWRSVELSSADYDILLAIANVVYLIDALWINLSQWWFDSDIIRPHFQLIQNVQGPTISNVDHCHQCNTMWTQSWPLVPGHLGNIIWSFESHSIRNTIRMLIFVWPSNTVITVECEQASKSRSCSKVNEPWRLQTWHITM